MFRGIYLDGKSSQGWPSTITFSPGNIHIVHVGKNLERREIIWEVSKIHKGDFSKSDKIYLKYGDFPYQYLEVNDPQFYSDLTYYFPEKKFNSSDFEFFRTKGFAGIMGVFIGVVLVGLSVYFYAIPEIADRFAQHMPQAYEERLGSSLYEKTLEGYDIDQPRTKLMNEFWRVMHYQSNYGVNITVVEEEDANAFAFPGGEIVVFNGIIKDMKSHEELVALLSHEFSHVALRHSSRAIMRSLSNYLFISVLFGDISGATAVVLQNADNLKSLSFSRELEAQADANGIALMQQHGISPQGMPDLFHTLKAVHDDMIVPRFLSSHPLTTERIETVNELIKKDQRRYEKNVKLERIWMELKATK